MISTGVTKGKGRGVFAHAAIAKGALVERAPALVLTAEQYGHVEKTILADYCFSWGAETAIVLGHVMLYNHSYAPNAKFVKRLDERVIEMIALRDISAGEEIVWNYNGDPDDDSPLWFQVEE